MGNCRRRAATVIDLLVTVAAAGLLAGVLMPSLLRVRQQAQIAASLSNLRQIAMAGTAAYVKASTSAGTAK